VAGLIGGVLCLMVSSSLSYARCSCASCSHFSLTFVVFAALTRRSQPSCSS
jgi:hypothetical protein